MGRGKKGVKRARAWVCRRGRTTTASPTSPSSSIPAATSDRRTPLATSSFRISATRNPRRTTPPSAFVWKAAHKARRQLPLIVSPAPSEISQTFVRLNGLKRHTPAHLRAPVRARCCWTFQVRFPFAVSGIIKSNAIPGDQRCLTSQPVPTSWIKIQGVGGVYLDRIEFDVYDSVQFRLPLINGEIKNVPPF